MITLDAYFMGRDRTHGLQLGTDLRANARCIVDLANRLLVLAKGAGVQLSENPATGTIVSSGWRPSDINAATPNAAKQSLHITCEAIDLYDRDGSLGRWLRANADTVLASLGLWLEDPSYTPTWAHVQSRPPASKRRVFIPR